MKIMYLDDSYRKEECILGYGGFHVNGSALRRIGDEVAALKQQYKIPLAVELKWAPPRDHYLRTRFEGVRHDLYRDALAILERNGAQIVCAVHFLNHCYGVSLHNWPMERAIPWAAKQQLKFLAERFQRPYLSSWDDCGLIIVDEFGSRAGQDAVIDGFSLNMLLGTEYETLDRIVSLPLIASSKRSPHLQLADITTGVIVAAFAGSRYGLDLFENVARCFFYNPHEGSLGFASTVSSAVMGFGLKVFPSGCCVKAAPLFAELDQRYTVTNEAGIHRREVAA
jgi:hypothetical protein